jgi:hypothetical protein
MPLNLSVDGHTHTHTHTHKTSRRFSREQIFLQIYGHTCAEKLEKTGMEAYQCWTPKNKLPTCPKYISVNRSCFVGTEVTTLVLKTNGSSFGLCKTYHVFPHLFREST